MDQPKRGRPSDYSADIAMAICRRLAGGESLRVICADAGMPDRATVFRWLDRKEDFRRRYALARECLAEDLFDEMREIADDRSEPIEHRRLRIKARKWTLTHLAPKKYRHR